MVKYSNVKCTNNYYKEQTEEESQCIEMRVGVFFDGTLNSYYSTDYRKKNPYKDYSDGWNYTYGSYRGDYTNVTKLYKTYETQGDDFKIYIEGPGVIPPSSYKDKAGDEHFYFDEEEMKKAFMDVYGNNPTQPGKLIIQVSKYNNWFDIYLEAGNKKYKFEKTKIHVFKQGVNDSDDKAVVIYNNHREINSKYIHFIGE